MAQLKLYWFTDSPMREADLPEGFSWRHPETAEDRSAWRACIRGGWLIDESLSDEAAWDKEIGSWRDIVPETDVWLLERRGTCVGTVTGFVRSDGLGDMHQVAIRQDWRGKGLGKLLPVVVQKDLRRRGVKIVELTTGEARPAAVKSYLRAGFIPVEYDEGMPERWETFLETLGIDSVPMVLEDGSFFRTLRRTGLKRTEGQGD